MSFLEPYLAHGPMVGSYGTSAIELICAEEPAQHPMADSPEMLPPISPSPPPSEENLSLEHSSLRESAVALAPPHSHSQPLPTLAPTHSQPLPALAPSLSQPLQALPPSQPAPTVPSQPGPRKKRKFASEELGNGWEKTATQYLERKLNQPEETESGEMLTLRGMLPHVKELTKSRKRRFFSKTHALLYSLLEEQEEEEMAESQHKETNV
ncbi:hypothetical protein ElyMa_006397400 [Elysia marginata]|uniref:BESS domain-containing protein n=1 Tax=Elysia marginata TaxID=1093978 RepID=A0AAV4HR73_9GAST|nr:hypothetical protein ElyMa_006397400 [Elysia marginata]